MYVPCSHSETQSEKKCYDYKSEKRKKPNLKQKNKERKRKDRKNKDCGHKVNKTLINIGDQTRRAQSLHAAMEHTAQLRRQVTFILTDS